MNHSLAFHAAICLLGLAATAAAQVGVTPNRELVAFPGQAFGPIPDTFVDRVTRCAIDNDGNIAWVGFLQLGGPTGVHLGNDQVLCLTRNGQDAILLAREGDPDPTGLSGYSLGYLGNEVVIGPGGQVAWSANLLPTSGRPLPAVYLTSAAGTSVLARFGDPAPLPLGGTIIDVGENDFGGFAWSDSGRVLMLGRSSAVGTLNAIFAGLPGQLEAVLYNGLILSDLPTQPEVLAAEASNLIGPDGAFPFTCRLTLGSGTPPATSGDNRILGVYRPGLPMLQIERAGQPALGLPGWTMSGWFLHSEQVGPNGEFAYRALARDAAFQIITALYKASMQTGARQLVVWQGQVLPNGLTVTGFGSTSTMFANGDLGFWCIVSGPGVDESNNEFYMVEHAGSLSVLFREGDPIPSLPGETFLSSNASDHCVDRYGNLVFRGFFRSLQPSSSGTFAYHPDRGFRNLAVTGEIIQSPLGAVTLLNDLGSDRSAGGSGNSSVNIHGDVARIWRMRTSTAAGVFEQDGILRTHVGALDPSTSAIRSSGGHQFVRIAAGAARANQLYLMLGSLSGTSPGFDYGGLHIPLVNDFWFGISQQNANSAVYLNSMGTLDNDGRGAVAFALPWNASFVVGARFHHAVLTVDPSTAVLSWVSEPVSVRIH